MSTPVISPIRNVARWSALATGLVYGYVHHNTLTALEHNKVEKVKIENRDRLISQAKAEWVRMNTPTGGVVTDPESPDFDLEKVLIHLSETA
ncbi:F-type H+-transporting ATP synthase subunit e [Entomortierella parvispora]|uniref:ATP synthase F(0) complex subunit e, mitochondrial n=1 Tax=Entomortierella parvispora TaxID=205924 RepID=A0A9P3H357_9FUNG|nr:F-type H+-transporting ATP synthase subunit e [Entomortierella parvispora]